MYVQLPFYLFSYLLASQDPLWWMNSAQLNPSSHGGKTTDTVWFLACMWCSCTKINQLCDLNVCRGSFAFSGLNVLALRRMSSVLCVLVHCCCVRAHQHMEPTKQTQSAEDHWDVAEKTQSRRKISNGPIFFSWKQKQCFGITPYRQFQICLAWWRQIELCLQ